MKKIIIAFILLGWQMTAQAQEKATKTPEQKAQHISARLTKELSLTEEQKNKIYTIALANSQSVEKARASHPNDVKSGHTEIKALRQNFDTQVKAILTKEQVDKWAQIKAEKKAKHQEHKKSNSN